MIKVLLVSDNHFNKRVLSDIAMLHNDCNYYLHLGDSEMYQDEIKPFVGVRGNNDFDKYPIERILEIAGHRILMLHGHRYISYFGGDLLYDKAKELNCDIVFYGHTHIFNYSETKGITFINPGSCSHNRDMSEPSYAIIEFDDNGEIKVYRKSARIGEKNVK